MMREFQNKFHDQGKAARVISNTPSLMKTLVELSEVEKRQYNGKRIMHQYEGRNIFEMESHTVFCPVCKHESKILNLRLLSFTKDNIMGTASLHFICSSQDAGKLLRANTKTSENKNMHPCIKTLIDPLNSVFNSGCRCCIKRRTYSIKNIIKVL